MGSSLVRTIGGLMLCLALCVFVGCGGGGGDPVAIGKEGKDAAAEVEAKKAGTQTEKDAAKAKVDAAKAKYDKLDDAGKKKAKEAGYPG